jgi:hypothetical protein
LQSGHDNTLDYCLDIDIGVFSSKHVSNGCSNPLIQVPLLPTANDGQNNQGVVDSKRSSGLLHDVLDGPFTNDGMLVELRDGYQDDSMSLFSESGLSAETDHLLSLGPVDQNKETAVWTAST